MGTRDVAVCVCLCGPFCTRSNHVTCCVSWELSQLSHPWRLTSNPNHNIHIERTATRSMAHNAARVSVLLVDAKRLTERLAVVLSRSRYETDKPHSAQEQMRMLLAGTSAQQLLLWDRWIREPLTVAAPSRMASSTV
jgi:hypothetical protein